MSGLLWRVMPEDALKLPAAVLQDGFHAVPPEKPDCCPELLNDAAGRPGGFGAACL